MVKSNSIIYNTMSKIEKLITAIRNNPKGIRFVDACKVAELLGFHYKGGQGSHRVFGRQDESKLLNFQNRDGFIPPYQGRQLIEMIDKYEYRKT